MRRKPTPPPLVAWTLLAKKIEAARDSKSFILTKLKLEVSAAKLLSQNLSAYRYPVAAMGWANRANELRDAIRDMEAFRASSLAPFRGMLLLAPPETAISITFAEMMVEALWVSFANDVTQPLHDLIWTPSWTSFTHESDADPGHNPELEAMRREFWLESRWATCVLLSQPESWVQHEKSISQTIRDGSDERDIWIASVIAECGTVDKAMPMLAKQGCKLERAQLYRIQSKVKNDTGLRQKAYEMGMEVSRRKAANETVDFSLNITGRTGKQRTRLAKPRVSSRSKSSDL